MTKIGSKEKAIIHVAKTQLGLADDVYRDILECVTGTRTSKDLNQFQFEKLMKRFEQLGFKNKNEKKAFPGHRQPYLKAPNRDAEALPSPAHLKRIQDLYTELGWTESERQQGLNRRIIKKPWPQSRSEANKIIEALKSMVARKQKTQYIGKEVTP